MGIFIPYFTCKTWNKNTQYVVRFIHNIGSALFVRIVEQYGFPEEAVLNGAEVFTLAAETVRQRLAIIAEVSLVMDARRALPA